MKVSDNKAVIELSLENFTWIPSAPHLQVAVELAETLNGKAVLRINAKNENGVTVLNQTILFETETLLYDYETRRKNENA